MTASSIHVHACMYLARHSAFEISLSMVFCIMKFEMHDPDMHEA